MAINFLTIISLVCQQFNLDGENHCQTIQLSSTVLHAVSTLKGGSFNCSQQTTQVIIPMIWSSLSFASQSTNHISKRLTKHKSKRAMSASANLTPVVSKIFCSPFVANLMVRKRPHVVNGGGFVVTDCTSRAIFSVDGCGVIGTKGELIIRDEDGGPVLHIQKKVML